MGRRRKPSQGPVNWTVVIVAAVLTLGIGITVAVLNSDKPGRIVVPQPTSTAVPVHPTSSSARLDPAVGTHTTTKTTTKATILPGSATTSQD